MRVLCTGSRVAQDASRSKWAVGLGISVGSTNWKRFCNYSIEWDGVLFPLRVSHTCSRKHASAFHLLSKVSNQLRGKTHLPQAASSTSSVPVSCSALLSRTIAWAFHWFYAYRGDCNQKCTLLGVLKRVTKISIGVETLWILMLF